MKESMCPIRDNLKVNGTEGRTGRLQSYIGSRRLSWTGNVVFKNGTSTSGHLKTGRSGNAL